MIMSQAWGGRATSAVTRRPCRLQQRLARSTIKSFDVLAPHHRQSIDLSKASANLYTRPVRLVGKGRVLQRREIRYMYLRPARCNSWLQPEIED